jgi:hypothetical protein
LCPLAPIEIWPSKIAQVESRRGPQRRPEFEKGVLESDTSVLSATTTARAGDRAFAHATVGLRTRRCVPHATVCVSARYRAPASVVVAPLSVGVAPASLVVAPLSVGVAPASVVVVPASIGAPADEIGALAHSQGPKCVPSVTQTCAPEHPDVVAHAWLAPGTQRGGAATLADAGGATLAIRGATGAFGSLPKSGTARRHRTVASECSMSACSVGAPVRA